MTIHFAAFWLIQGRRVSFQVVAGDEGDAYT